MGDLIEQLGDLFGASNASVDWMFAVLAVLLIVFGAIVLLVTLFGKWARTLEQDTSSRLLPTLVEDVLDVDLQRVYRRSLMLDSQIAHSFDGLADPTGTELGRKARQIIVHLQAERFSARQETQQETRQQTRQQTRQETDEPPGQEARLKEVSAVIDQALDELPVGRPSATDSAAADQAARWLAAEQLERLSTRIRAVDSKRPGNPPA